MRVHNSQQNRLASDGSEYQCVDLTHNSPVKCLMEPTRHVCVSDLSPVLLMQSASFKLTLSVKLLNFFKTVWENAPPM